MKSLTAAFLLAPMMVSAQVTKYEYKEKLFPTVAGKCSIKRFGLSTFLDRRKSDRGEDLDTAMAALIETSDPSCLKDYGVVQYIKGCVQDVFYSPVRDEYSAKFLTRDFNEGVYYFVHPNWEVDSTNADPLYYNLAGDWDRTDTYLSPNKPLRLKNTQTDLKLDKEMYFNSNNYTSYYFAKEKKVKQYFAIDTPTGTNYRLQTDGDTRITYSNLGFKTCVYDMKNVPTSSAPKDPSVPRAQGGPIHCLEWSHQYFYDVKKKDFTKKDFDPYCSSFNGERKVKVMGVTSQN